MRVSTSAKAVLTTHKDRNGSYNQHGVSKNGLQLSAAEQLSFYTRSSMFVTRLFPILLFAYLAYYVTGFATGIMPSHILKHGRNTPLQKIVTWDEHSIFVHGERIVLYSGEFHPFRLPVPGLWLDVFQKVKAAGFSAVSFYTDWSVYPGPDNLSY